VAAAASSLAVLVALVIGVLTLRQWQRARHLTAAAELVRTVLTPDFTRAIARVVELPERAPVESIATPDLLHAITVVTHGFEGLGVLVFHRLLPLHLVDHLAGGYVRASWRRLQPYIEARRGTLGPMFGEWFQWLAERMNEDPAPGKSVGAYLAHREWKQ
jgi:hypothetical protein